MEHSEAMKFALDAVSKMDPEKDLEEAKLLLEGCIKEVETKYPSVVCNYVSREKTSLLTMGLLS